MSLKKQPWLGVAATGLVIVASLVFIAPLSWATFGGWVSFVMMCAIPFAIVVGAYWHGEEPAAVARLGQPARGLAYLGLAAVVAAVVATVLWLTVGGAVSPPLPMLAMATILSVVTSFWLTIMWGGWPFSLIRNRLVSGLVLLAGTYAVAALLFVVFFSFDFLTGAPIYDAALDPGGLFDGWDATVVAVTFLAVMFLVLHLDLWPLTRSASVMTQPVLGLVWTALALVVALAPVLPGHEDLRHDAAGLPRHRAHPVHLRFRRAAHDAAGLAVRRARAAGPGRGQRRGRGRRGHRAGAPLPPRHAAGDRRPARRTASPAAW